MQVFKSARIKLTVLYLAIIMLITVAFSTGVYSILSREVERFARAQRSRLESRLPAGINIPRPSIGNEDSTRLPPIVDPDLVEETKMRILVTLIIIDGVILVSSGLLAYFLAGRTLTPIKDMVDDQNRFISDASHELKTPLTALKSSFEVFLRDKNTNVGEARQLIKEGVKDVDSLTSLTTSLLELTRVKNSDHKIDFVRLELDKAISDAMEKIKPLALENRIELVYTKTDLKVLGDNQKLTELFVILLDNAVKYSHANGLVEIKVSKDDGHVAVEIKDSGVGISAHDLPHIFERFYQADVSRSKNIATGYGLGLAIAKGIIEEHGGTMTATSQLGQGSTFKVTFRLAHLG